MEIIYDFLGMGGYAVFVWSSYLIVVCVLFMLFYISRLRFKRAIQNLNKVEKLNDEGSIEA